MILLGRPTNTILPWNGLQGMNTLAYYENSELTAVKSFFNIGCSATETPSSKEAVKKTKREKTKTRGTNVSENKEVTPEEGCFNYFELMTPTLIDGKTSYVCKICSKSRVFSSRGNLVIHLTSHYRRGLLKMNEDDSKRCRGCSRSFVNSQGPML